MKTKANPYLKVNIPINELIPKDIQKIVDERGFYLYEWISFDELKDSIKASFIKSILKIMSWLKKVTLTLPAITFIILLILSENYFTSFVESNPNLLFYLIVFTVLGIALGLILSIILIFISMIIISIKNTYYFLKSYQVIVTKNNVSILGKIIEINKKSSDDKDIIYVSKFFHENLFGKSEVKNIKQKYITRIKYDSDPLYLFSIYYTSLLFLFFLLPILKLIIKFILTFKSRNIKIINMLFTNISKNSEQIIKSSSNLNNYLNQVISKNWGTPTYKKINHLFDELSKATKQSVEDSIELKKALQNYKHSEMFNIKLYNSWIKKKIIEPIAGIDKILKSEISNIEKELTNIDKQLLKIKDSSLRTPLTLSQKRLVMKKEQMVNNSSMIEGYLGKLK